MVNNEAIWVAHTENLSISVGSFQTYQKLNGKVHQKFSWKKSASVCSQRTLAGDEEKLFHNNGQ